MDETPRITRTDQVTVETHVLSSRFESLSHEFGHCLSIGVCFVLQALDDSFSSLDGVILAEFPLTFDVFDVDPKTDDHRQKFVEKLR